MQLTEYFHPPTMQTRREGSCAVLGADALFVNFLSILGYNKYLLTLKEISSG